MAIYYKFKSAKDYDTMPIDGPFILIGFLKDKIIQTKHLASGRDLDIVVSNAQTNEEYLDEAMLIPKNTSVLIRRVPKRPHIRVNIAQEPIIVKKVDTVNADISNYPVSVPSALKYPEDEWDDEFGNDLYNIPQRNNNLRPNVAPVDEKVDEESKLQALVNTPALDWQQGQGNGKVMNGRMGVRNGFVNSPPPGYICHRCKIPGHFIQYCSTNGDPSYDIKRVKPPTGIPKSMLVANPDGSYSLPSGAVAVLKPNEDAFDKEMEGVSSSTTTRSVSEIPAELKCPLCKEVMRDAAFTSKCCFQSFCDKCIRDHIIAKLKCYCGATNVLADDILPNKTVRDTINRYLEEGNSSTGNTGSVGDLGSTPSQPPKVIISPSTSKDEKRSAVSNNNNEASTSKPPMEIAEVTSVAQASIEVRVEKPADACEESVVDEVEQQVVAGEQGKRKLCSSNNIEKEKKKKIRAAGTGELSLYPMQMGPGPHCNPQYFNGMQPGFNSVQPGFNGFQPGFNGYNGYPFPGAIPPFMDYRLNPMNMNIMHQGFPNRQPPPPPQRDIAVNHMSHQHGMMSIDEFEARKGEMSRKRESERRNEGEKMVRDGESSRMIMDNGRRSSASTVASSINPSKYQTPAPSNDRTRRPGRSSSDHPTLRKTSSSSRHPKSRSERYPDQRDRERSCHQDVNQERDRTRDRRDESRNREDRNHLESERNKHHQRKRSDPPTKSDMENDHKSSICKEESPSKRRKVSLSSSTVGVPDHHSRKEKDYESSDDEDRHFKRRRPSRYE